MSQYSAQSSFLIYPNYPLQNNKLVHSNFIPSNSLNFSQQGTFLNRNTRELNMSSNSIGKNRLHHVQSGKLKRQNSLNMQIQFKQNDPYSKNCNNLNFLNNASTSRKKQIQEQHNSYYNPMILKRQKKIKKAQNINEKSNFFNLSHNQELKNQSLKNSNISKQFQNQQTTFSQQILNSLQMRISELQKKTQSHATLINQSSKKLNQSIKTNCSQISQSINEKHLRSLSTATNSSKNYRELTQIMTLIEQTKDYQRKNSQEYRKMIQDFRTTILQFRDQLNQTIKRKDYEAQTRNVKCFIQQLKAKIFDKTEACKTKEDQSNENIIKELIKIQKQSLQQKIEEIKQEINKLQQNNISLKADLVKINFRQKIATEQNQNKSISVEKILTQLKQKINMLSQKTNTLSQKTNMLSQKSEPFKSGAKCETKIISFSIQQTLINEQLQNWQNKSDSNINKNILKNNQNLINSFSIKDGDSNKKPHKMQISLSKKTYYIDTQGYLLDSNSRYLLNQRQQTIKISSKQLSLLRKYGVLSE